MTFLLTIVVFVSQGRAAKGHARGSRHRCFCSHTSGGWRSTPGPAQCGAGRASSRLADGRVAVSSPVGRELWGLFP